MRHARTATQLAAPVVLIVATGVLGSFMNPARAIEFKNALIMVALVVGLHVFIGNSGVLSFGQVGFFIVGAYAAGEMSLPADVKPGVLPNVFSVIRDHTLSNFWSLVLAAAVGAVYALAVGVPLMRLSGLAAGIATFAVLGITYNIMRNWEQIGPGPLTLSTVPETTDLWQASVAAIAVVCVAFLYQRSRLGRKLRATREDPFAARAAGIEVRRERLWAFVLSGALCGFAGGIYVHFTGTLNIEDVYLNLTFLSLAMLVVGGIGSLGGAVLGALVVSGLDSFLLNAENEQVSWLDAPDGTRLVVVAAFMAAVLVLLPRGLTGGRELGVPTSTRRARRS